MAKTRTFVAIDASPDVREHAQSLAKQLKPHAGDLRWVAPEGLHYTLAFLGDLTDQEVAEVCSQVGQVAAHAVPFALQAAGVGAFPDLDRPRTLWIGAGQGEAQLIALQEKLERTLADLGYRGENRRYVPHLTIGKSGRSAGDLKQLKSKLQELADYDAGTMEVAELTVFASELLREGPEYHVLARCPLQG